MLDRSRGLSARIAQLWALPPQVRQAILEAGRADAAPLAQALRLGDRLARLRVLFDAGVEGAAGLAASLPAAQLRPFEKLPGEAQA